MSQVECRLFSKGEPMALAGGEIVVWCEQGGPIMIKAISGTDPVEINSDEARDLIKVLEAMIKLEEA